MTGTGIHMKELMVSEIWIYPVKSLGGIQMDVANVLPKGLEHDRRWMLIDKDNNFLTQRVYPKMAIFKLESIPGGFCITCGDQSINLPFESGSELIQAKVWNDDVWVQEVSSAHDEWFSTLLGIRCRLVAFPENSTRPVEDNAIHTGQVSLADAYPLLIIGQSSLDDLNSRMEQALPMNRFRPNIVFTGGEAFEEDRWETFRIGSSRFASAKLCSRCVLTTVDQETGIKGREPLVTLAAYRKKGNNIYFGQNLLPLSGGQIRTGEKIILE